MSLKSTFITILITSSMTLGGCGDSNTEQAEKTKPISPPKTVVKEPKPTHNVRFLDQGLSEEDRLAFYYLSQGSQLLPYSWFIALETSHDEAEFKSDNNMRSLGFIPQAKDTGKNPDGLPVGFVKNDSSETVSYAVKKEFLGPDYDTSKYPPTNAWLGLTCANCHTSEISFKGQKIRIDGAPALSDQQAFLEQLVAALQATTRSADKMTRFAKRVLKPNWNPGEQDALQQRVEAYTPVLERLRDQNKTPLRYGFGRLDAFGAIFNRVLVTGLEIPENHFPSDAPVSYPFLWDTPRLLWVQYNSLAGSPIDRNIGEVIGVFAHLQLQGTPASSQFKSTVDLGNLDRLERYVAQLKAPSWPIDVLGKIDLAKKAAGKQLYVKNCVHCHSVRDEKGHFPMITDSKTGAKFIITHSEMPLEELGTDPKMVLNAVKYSVDPGVLRPYLPEMFRDPEKAPKVPRAVVLKTAVGAVVNREIDETGLQGKDKEDYALVLNGERIELLRPPKEILGTYRARPINGIWATAPFLHNGSVPSLYQLLLPAEQRVKTFKVGSNQFDPIKVGFVTDQGFEFNTALLGNFNIGHSGPRFTQGELEDGSFQNFTDEERMALIEYIKTLN